MSDWIQSDSEDSNGDSSDLGFANHPTPNKGQQNDFERADAQQARPNNYNRDRGDYLEDQDQGKRQDHENHYKGRRPHNPENSGQGPKPSPQNDTAAEIIEKISMLKKTETYFLNLYSVNFQTIEDDIRGFYKGVEILSVWVNKENYKIYDLEFETLDELKKVLDIGTGNLHGSPFYFRYSFKNELLGQSPEFVIRGNETAHYRNPRGRGGTYRHRGGDRGPNPRYEGGRGGGENRDFKYGHRGGDREGGYRGGYGRGGHHDGEDRDDRRGGDRRRGDGDRGGRGRGRGGYNRDADRGGFSNSNTRGGRDRGGDRGGDFQRAYDRFNQPGAFAGILAGKGSALGQKNADGEPKQKKNEGLFAKDNNEISHIEVKTQNDSGMDNMLPEEFKTAPVTKMQNIVSHENMLGDAAQDLVQEISAEEKNWNSITNDMETDWLEYVKSMKSRNAKKELRERSDEQIEKDKKLYQSEEVVASQMEQDWINRQKEGFQKKNLRTDQLMNKMAPNQATGGQRGGDSRGAGGNEPAWNTGAKGTRAPGRNPDFDDVSPGSEERFNKTQGDYNRDFPNERPAKNFIFGQNSSNSGNRGPRDENKNQNSEYSRNKDLQMTGGGRNDSLFEQPKQSDRKPSDSSWQQTNPNYRGSNMHSTNSRGGYARNHQNETPENLEKERNQRNSQETENRNLNYNRNRQGSGQNHPNDGQNESNRGAGHHGQNYNSNRGSGQDRPSGYSNSNNEGRQNNYNSHFQNNERPSYRGASDSNTRGYGNMGRHNNDRPNQENRSPHNDRREEGNQQMRENQERGNSPQGGFNSGPNNNENWDRDRNRYDAGGKDAKAANLNSSYQGESNKSGGGARDMDRGNQDSANVNENKSYENRNPRYEGNSSNRGERDMQDQQNNALNRNAGNNSYQQGNQSNQNRDLNERPPRRDSEGNNYENAGERQTQNYNSNYQGSNPSYRGKNGNNYRGSRGGNGSYHNNRGGNRDNYGSRGSGSDNYNKGHGGPDRNKNDSVYDLKGTNPEEAPGKNRDAEGDRSFANKSGKGSQRNEDLKKDNSRVEGQNESKNEEKSQAKDSAKGGSKNNLDESASDVRYEVRDRERNSGHGENRRGGNSNYRGNNRNNNYNSNYNKNNSNAPNDNLDMSGEGYTSQRNSDNYHGNRNSENYRGNNSHHNPNYHGNKEGGEVTHRGGYQGNRGGDNYNRDNRGRGRGNFHERGGRGGYYNNQHGYNNRGGDDYRKDGEFVQKTENKEEGGHKKFHNRNNDGGKRGGYQGNRDWDKNLSPDEDFKKKSKKGKMMLTDSNPFSILKSDK